MARECITHHICDCQAEEKRRLFAEAQELRTERDELRNLLDECVEYVVEAQNVATCGGRLEYKGRAEGYLLLRIEAALAKGRHDVE